MKIKIYGNELKADQKVFYRINVLDPFDTSVVKSHSEQVI